MPFGGESFPDSARSQELRFNCGESPMPFGGESFPDKSNGEHVVITSLRHQCLSAGSPFRTLPFRTMTTQSIFESPMPFGGESFPDIG